jgi:hypothetical protein
MEAGDAHSFGSWDRHETDERHAALSEHDLRPAGRQRDELLQVPCASSTSTVFFVMALTSRMV